MSQIVISNNSARQHTFTGKKGDNPIVLIPGHNVVDAADFEKVRKGNDAIAHLEEIGEIEILSDAGVTATGEINISSLSVKKAVEVINSTPDVDTLNKYMDQENDGGAKEGRKGVVAAINSQIEALSKKADENDDKE